MAILETGRTLQVTAQPFGAKQNQILQPPFRVELRQNGFLDAGLVSGEVVVSLLNPDRAVLRGTLVRPLKRGIATFPDLSISHPGVYRLQFSCQEEGLQYLDQPRTDVRWRVYGVPISNEYVGYWVHWGGPGVPMGIWAKIVRIHTDTWGSCWEVSQPVGATDGAHPSWSRPKQTYPRAIPVASCDHLRLKTQRSLTAKYYFRAIPEMRWSFYFFVWDVLDCRQELQGNSRLYIQS